jgi:phosphoribosylanthranilate isomerase
LAEVVAVARETRPDIIQVQAAAADFPLALVRALKALLPEIAIMRAVAMIDETAIVAEVGIPAILAGGLGPDNVAAAIAAVRPAGVDSKTRTDRADGTGKELDMVREFVAAAKITR